MGNSGSQIQTPHGKPPAGPGTVARARYWPWLFAAGVLVSRVLTTGPVYWADGPRHIKAILSKTFLIQPPGYWLFNRSAALFPNPALGISLMNWVFSAAGAVIFYYAALELAGRRLAILGTALYAVLFYAWFSGDVHSTYASQLLAPVLVFELLLLHHRKGQLRYLIGAAIAFGIGAGFRPSDGAFIGLMFVYYLVRHSPRRQAAVAFFLAVAICLGWLVPTLVGYSSLGGLAPAAEYVASQTTRVSILVHGPTHIAIASMLRFAVPLLLALGPLLPFTLMSYRELRRPEVTLLWLWVIPGGLYLFLCAMWDAPYLNFLTAAVLLLGLMELQKSSRHVQTILLGTCIVWNLGFFLMFRPVRARTIPAAMFDSYAGEYTRYGIANRWEPSLGSLLHGGTR